MRIFSLIGALPLILIVVADHRSGLPVGLWAHVCELIVLALIIPSILTQRWLGITLTADEAQVHNLRSHRIRWRNIQAVTTENQLGTQRVLLWTDDGRRIALRAPVGGPFASRRNFDRDYDIIGQWWLAHRGSDWKPVPPAERHPSKV